MTVRLRTETTKAVPSTSTRASREPLAAAAADAGLEPWPSWPRSTAMPRRLSRSSAWPREADPAALVELRRAAPGRSSGRAPSAAACRTARAGGVAPTPGGASAGFVRIGSATSV